MSLRDAWNDNADAWIRWARAPGHDAYWRFHGAAFLQIVPPPGRLTVDIGCGEGRLGRDLLNRGHRVVAIDGALAMARACATHEVAQPAVVADAARLPLPANSADLAIAFMSLQDVDDLEGAVREIGRILSPDGRLCLAIVHPLNSAGQFEGEAQGSDAPFVIRGPYLRRYRYADQIERDGLAMTFHSEHRPLGHYSKALEQAGFVIEAIREVTVEDPDNNWHRLPMFLHMRAIRLGPERKPDQSDGCS